MKNYFISLYQVLKIIELASYSDDNSYINIFNLDKLQITERELNIIVTNIVNEKLAIGIAIIDSLGFKIIEPQLTTRGYEFLENNSSMKKAYNALKEIKGWIPGMG